MDDFLRSGTPHVRVVIDDHVRAAEVLRSAGWRVEFQDAGLCITCRDGGEPDPASVARVLGAEDLWPRELRADRHSLEQVFLELTADTNLPSREAA